ncbi:MAG: bifunctional tetrahydrofolate synthase/dihydrofolate synthase [Betaproteobacteria bacterium]|nr:bifunctional tetrahydrofolate synthase/dihydrofolate synthase [Betaproteobacteria bacterium]
MPSSLEDWLAFIERQHPKSIALGLDRVATVRDRLGVSAACPVFIVGGTNGKGSTCAMLESILRCAGYRTGLYTSPHLLRYNERVRIDSRQTPDDALCAAFQAVEHARGETPLTYFEYGTLAAAWLFAREPLDAWILEVGLGGRLDAVNVFDADCAVLTSIDMDHMDYLGPTREDIGREKAGIFRHGRTAIVADATPPRSVLEVAAGIGAVLLQGGRDFGFSADSAQWVYWGPGGKRVALAYPALRGSIQLVNAATAIAAVDVVRTRLPVAMQDVRRGLAEVEVAGRFQMLAGRPSVILDVAHNPQAARNLAANLGDSGFAPETHAVFGALRDKDIAGVVRALAARITRWHLATLRGPRGTSAAELAGMLEAEGIGAPVEQHASPALAFEAARMQASEADKIVVFGSFLTVAAVMDHLSIHGTSGNR